MGTVLLGWELGGGLGHASTLIEVARALADRGHAPVLALKDPVAPRAVLTGVRCPVVPAPVWRNAVPSNFRAATLADVLAIRGYDDPGVLGSLVEGWQGLLHLTRADLVIADYAPTLLLAASGAVPAIQLGSGFSIPPAPGDDFPVLDRRRPPAACWRWYGRFKVCEVGPSRQRSPGCSRGRTDSSTPFPSWTCTGLCVVTRSLHLYAARGRPCPLPPRRRSSLT